MEEKIGAFLEGPPARPIARGRHAGPAHPTLPVQPERLDHPLKLDSRSDWNAVLHLEAARHARYGRPAAVAVIEVVVLDAAGGEPSRIAVDAIAGSLAQLLRSSMRETDRIARMGPTRFNVLLPETSRAEARRFAERARRAGELAFTREPLRLVLKIAIAAAARDQTLADALATAELELAR